MLENSEPVKVCLNQMASTRPKATFYHDLSSSNNVEIEWRYHLPEELRGDLQHEQGESRSVSRTRPNQRGGERLGG